MKLTEVQLQMLRRPFDKEGAFVGRSEKEIKKLLEDIAEIYITLAESNLNLKNRKSESINNI